MCPSSFRFFFISLFSFLICSSAIAQHSPWLLSPNEKFVTFSVVNQNADSAFISATAQNLPNNGRLDQTTYWFNLQSGLIDGVNLELSQGYSVARFDNTETEKDLTDTTLGLSFQVVDEFLDDILLRPSISLHLYKTIAGDYRTQQITAIGDGADSLELSASFGKVFRYFGIYGDVGYRDRQDTLPDDYFWNIALFASISSHWNITGGYQSTNAGNDIDRSDPNDSLLEEDTQRYSFSFQYQWSHSSLNLGYSRVIDGRNTPESNIYSVSIRQRL